MAHNYRVREGERKQGTCDGDLHGWGVHRGGRTLMVVLLACAGRRRSGLLLVGGETGWCCRLLLVGEGAPAVAGRGGCRLLTRREEGVREREKRREGMGVTAS